MTQSALLLAPLALLVCTPACAQQPDGWRTDFTKHTVPLDEIVPGGPPKDGIPALDDPHFQSVAEAARWLAGPEPVIAFELNGEAKAYPLQILMWHEVVNDRIGGTPVAVTYCPLCNTALVFERRMDGRVLDFGSTGRLRYSDLVMYDRQSESWWQQATGEAIVGRYAGRRLRHLGGQLVSWEEFSSNHPSGRILSRETGYERPYGHNPYVGYDDPAGSPFPDFFPGPADQRLPAMERVVALDVGGRSLAFPFSTLRRRRVVNDQVGTVPLVVLWGPGSASAVDAEEIARGRDVGSAGVFDRRLNRRTLAFRRAGDGLMRDRQTGTRWNLLGRATAGPLAGAQLRPVPHSVSFWFALVAFRPDTHIKR